MIPYFDVVRPSFVLKQKFLFGLFSSGKVFISSLVYWAINGSRIAHYCKFNWLFQDLQIFVFKNHCGSLFL